MKKFYVFIVVIICFVASGYSQTWVGGPSGNWNNTANWLPAVVPNSATADVVFESNSVVELDISVDIRSFNINGAFSVEIDGGVGLNGFTVASGATFSVPATSTLRLIQTGFTFPSDIQGTVGGTLILEGTDDSDYTLLEFDAPISPGAAFNINGTLTDTYGKGLLGPEAIFNFGSASKFRLTGIAPIVPAANYDPASEIIITGVETTSVTIEERDDVGVLTYNCTGQSDDLFLSLGNDLTVAQLNIQNTNGQNLTLISNVQIEFPTQTNYSFTVNGNLSISGNSTVSLANSEAADDASNIYSATVNGNFTMSGNSFSILRSTLADIQPTTLYVKGNINHTAGTITENSTADATSVSLYNIEMIGTGAQTIFSTPTTFTGNQVALKISNTSPAGVTLTSALSVGMLGLSANAKLNTTDLNYLTILNPSVDAYVVSGTGVVVGPVRRVTNSMNEYIFPTGFGTTPRYVSVFPAANTTSTYEAFYTNASPGNTTVNAPLTDIVDYYWEVDRIGSGANAAVELTLPGEVSEASDSDYLIVAKSSGGSNWDRAFHPTTNTFLPGTATSGKLRSAVQTSFSSFTIAWAPLDAALPINLLSFTANKSGSKANLNWKISGNSTPQSFDIIKSADGVNFSKLATVTGLQSKLSYDFADNNLSAGNNYYRLKMFDIDGTVSYSNIIVVMNGTSGTLISSMIPTMVLDRARLNISSSSKGKMQLVITDINGRIVLTQNASINAGNQEVWINASRLATGYFQVTGFINSQKTETIRFFKK